VACLRARAAPPFTRLPALAVLRLLERIGQRVLELQCVASHCHDGRFGSARACRGRRGRRDRQPVVARAQQRRPQHGVAHVLNDGAALKHRGHLEILQHPQNGEA
jgi:hypothetical protein